MPSTISACTTYRSAALIWSGVRSNLNWYGSDGIGDTFLLSSGAALRADTSTSLMVSTALSESSCGELRLIVPLTLEAAAAGSPDVDPLCATDCPCPLPEPPLQPARPSAANTASDKTIVRMGVNLSSNSWGSYGRHGRRARFPQGKASSIAANCLWQQDHGGPRALPARGRIFRGVGGSRPGRPPHPHADAPPEHAPCRAHPKKSATLAGGAEPVNHGGSCSVMIRDQ